MHRVVLDTNILVSGIGWAGAPGRVIRKCFDGKLILVESPALLTEFLNVLRDDKFDFLDPEDIDEFYRILVEKAEVVEPAFKVDIISEDDADNRVIECALAGRAGFIVSGDRHLLRLGEFAGIRMLTAGQMSGLIP
jgi:putative PIN family toxin of toxin-antitoxin system